MSEAKQIRLETLPSFFSVDFSLKENMMGISLKHKGLDIPNAKISVGGAKHTQNFFLPGTEQDAVKIVFEDVIDQGKISKIKKTSEYYFTDDSVYCSKVEHEIVRDEDALIRKRYDRAYTHLRKSAKGTPVESYVNQILDHYSSEVSVWLLGNPQKFIDAINGEVDQVIIQYLSIVVGVNGKTVKDGIVEQLTGAPFSN